MKSQILLTTNNTLFSSTPQCHTKTKTKTKTCLPLTTPSLLFLNKICTNFNHLQLARGLRLDGPIIMDADELEEIEDSDLVVETCITRTLPPALTLEHGVHGIKEAIDKLKLNPPSSTSGIFRFQVAVPPSAKALNWFCCQPESSLVFPLFFLSKETENPTYKSLYLNETRGVFGVGAAIYFRHSSSCAPGERSLIKRYLSNHSTLITTYGFMDISFDTESSSMKHEAGSFYFFIPQIELDECGDISILAATLAWSDSCFCTFEQAIHSYESSYYQITCHFWPTTERWHMKFIRSTLKKLNVVEDETVSMVYMNSLSLDGKDFRAEPMQLVSPIS